MGIENFINNVNQFTQTMGAVQGAADALMPALNTVDQSLNQVASVFTGDTYYPPVYQPPPVYMPPPTPGSGIVGSLLAGGVGAAVTHKAATKAMQDMKLGTPGAGKALGMTTLKAGGIGALVGGVTSAVKNFSDSSKGLITTQQAVGNTVADTVGGLLAGSTAGITGGLAGLALSGMGVAGLGLTIGATIAGAAGGAIAHVAFNGTGARDGLANAIGGGQGNYGNYGGGYGPQQGYGGYGPQQGYGPQPYYGY